MWQTRVLIGRFFQPSLSVLYMLSDGATHEAVHLLCRMLVFDPVSWCCWLRLWRRFPRVVTPHLAVQAKRISGSDALSHPYLDEGRLRYHTCMCQCCYSVPSGRVYTRDFEPVAERPFSHSYENSLLSVWQGKGQGQRLDCLRVMWPLALICCSVLHLRADPSLHHGAPAREACAAVHQPSERCIQDLHQVRKRLSPRRRFVRSARLTPSPPCPQVNGLALVQGVQEGGEMSDGSLEMSSKAAVWVWRSKPAHKLSPTNPESENNLFNPNSCSRCFWCWIYR